MEFIVKDHIINYDVVEILKDIRSATKGRYLNHINVRGDNAGVTCPFHKDGHESHPSCYVYLRMDNEDVPYGFFRCFTCGSQGTLDYLVSKCFNCSLEAAQNWLLDNYSSVLVDDDAEFPDADLLPAENKKVYLNEDDLNQFAYIHPYILSRKISEEILLKFKVGWNPKTNSITFPVWDEHGGLVGVTERNVINKYFNIPHGMGKPVYLLNFIKDQDISEVYVVESQIDALYLWTLGRPAIALFGTGSKAQYKILMNSEIWIYHLAMDGDLAGRQGIKKFINNMSDVDVTIDVLTLPDGKDINDLSEEEISTLEKKAVDSSDYLINY